MITGEHANTNTPFDNEEKYRGHFDRPKTILVDNIIFRNDAYNVSRFGFLVIRTELLVANENIHSALI